ncbi:MAG TPA: tetratricopeptide repeat protein [bacterium]|nr:tetratricopeptide repeat protein [bacterium]HQP98766.1 tetratricopeptide repeat protein [bacterium]
MKRRPAKPTSTASRRSDFPANPWFQTSAILLFVFLVYSPSLSAPWYFDDEGTITENLKLRNMYGIRYIVADFIHRGAVQLSYALDWQLSERFGVYAQDASGNISARHATTIYHLSSIVYHLLNVAGVFLLIRKMMVLLRNRQTGESGQVDYQMVYLPPIAALLYGLHPINTEAVTYLSGRASVLATVAYVFGMWSLLIAAERFGLLDEHPEERSRRDRIIGTRVSLCTVACFILGIGSKEIIVTMPVTGVAILAPVAAHRLSWRTALRRLVPFCAVAGLLVTGFFAYRIQALGGIIGFEEAEIRPWWVNLLSQIGVISLYYLPRQLCLLPLCIDPQVPEIHSASHPNVIFGIIILGGLVFLAVRYAKRAPLVTIGLLWYFIALVPTSSIVPLNDLAAERHIYLPNVGFVLAFVAILGQWIEHLVRQRIRGRAVMAVAMVACTCVFVGALTVKRNLLYTDPIRFWQDTERHSPDNPRVQYHLATSYALRGIRYSDLNAANEAVKICEKILAKPERFSPRTSEYFGTTAMLLGCVYMRNFKEYDKAARVFEFCIEHWPDRSESWKNLGVCYLLTKKFDKAKELSDRWLEREPDNVSAKLLVANSLFMQKHLGEAETRYLEILKTHGEITNALDNLSNIARMKGDAGAAKEYEARASASRRSESPGAPGEPPRSFEIQANEF